MWWNLYVCRYISSHTFWHLMFSLLKHCVFICEQWWYIYIYIISIYIDICDEIYMCVDISPRTLFGTWCLHFSNTVCVYMYIYIRVCMCIEALIRRSGYAEAREISCGSIIGRRNSDRAVIGSRRDNKITMARLDDGWWLFSNLFIFYIIFFPETDKLATLSALSEFRRSERRSRGDQLIGDSRALSGDNGLGRPPKMWSSWDSSIFLCIRWFLVFLSFQSFNLSNFSIFRFLYWIFLQDYR